MHNLDKIDIAILNLLQEDSTTSVKDIATKVGLSQTPTYERIKHLEDSGVIVKYMTVLDAHKIGFNLMAYCNVTLKEQSKNALLDFEKAVIKIPQIMEVTSLTGTYDYMLKIIAKDIAGYNEFVVTTLAGIKNIGQYHSHIVMNEVKREIAYPLQNQL
jgi:Lrp/AsnC family transcriptional regulator, leucine-responsive regulatory protein